jgi:hypothetical protein
MRKKIVETGLTLLVYPNNSPFGIIALPLPLITGYRLQLLHPPLSNLTLPCIIPNLTTNPFKCLDAHAFLCQCPRISINYNLEAFSAFIVCHYLNTREGLQIYISWCMIYISKDVIFLPKAIFFTIIWAYKSFSIDFLWVLSTHSSRYILINWLKFKCHNK